MVMIGPGVSPGSSPGKGGGGGGIDEVASADGSVGVTDPTGPDTDLKVVKITSTVGIPITDNSTTGITIKEEGTGLLKIESLDSGVVILTGTGGIEISTADADGGGSGGAVQIFANGGGMTLRSDDLMEIVGGGNIAIIAEDGVGDPQDVSISNTVGTISINHSTDEITLTIGSATMVMSSGGGVSFNGTNWGVFGVEAVQQSATTLAQVISALQAYGLLS